MSSDVEILFFPQPKGLTAQSILTLCLVMKQDQHGACSITCTSLPTCRWGTVARKEVRYQSVPLLQMLLSFGHDLPSSTPHLYVPSPPLLHSALTCLPPPCCTDGQEGYGQPKSADADMATHHSGHAMPNGLLPFCNSHKELCWIKCNLLWHHLTIAVHHAVWW